MPPTDQQFIKKLRSTIGDDVLGKEDFVRSFTGVAQLIIQLRKSLKKENAEALQRLTKLENELVKQLDELFVGERVEKIKKDLDTVVNDAIKRLEDTADKKVSEVDDRLSKVKDGKTPVKGVDFFDGRPGRDGRDIKPNEVIRKINRGDEKIDRERVEGLDDDIKRLGRGLIMTGQNPSSMTILTTNDAVNGTNTTFDFGQKPTAVVVNGAFYREDNGWAWTNNKVELDNPVGAGGDIYAIL